ncbi:MAG: hypothetical protein Q9P14_10510 [candidate division KSB1 bacterium]|nr:hypothetical protein [candidate division KSB1 bacterium]MDQ7065178.1 hypothetical protein [candidate division KSB1 bacterium]
MTTKSNTYFTTRRRSRLHMTPAEIKFLVFLFMVLIFLPLLVQEIAQPHYMLKLKDALKSPSPALRASMALDLHATLYADTKPFVGRIATLQKGVVISYKGKPIIGEGYGLGVPIVHKDGTPWLASRAKIGRFTRGDTVILAKVYYYDTIETDKEIPRLRYRRQGRVLTRIRVNYFIYQNRVDVVADLRDARRKGAEEVFFMNELSGHLFRYAITQNRRKLDLLNWQLAPSGLVGLVSPKLGLTMWVQCNDTWDRFLGREVLSSWKWYGHIESDWTGCVIHVEKMPARFQYTLFFQKQ